MFDDSDGFPFVAGGRVENIGSLHPPVIEILQLWQVYIQRVDPLLKITHLPTPAGADCERRRQADRHTQAPRGAHVRHLLDCRAFYG